MHIYCNIFVITTSTRSSKIELLICAFILRSEALNLPKEFCLMMDTFNERQDTSKRRENN